jgi:hypothetical protein
VELSWQHSMQRLMVLLFFISMICSEIFIPLLLMLNMNKTKLPISDKEKVREEVQRRISLLSLEEKNKAAQVVSKKLLELNIVQKSTNIILYEALPDELNLKYFIENVQRQHKNIIIITPSGDFSNLPEE